VTRLRGWVHTFGGLVLAAGLLLLVNVLPPDTALQEVRASGVLRACIPPSYPPLVTGDPEAPGIDVEILQAVAARIGVALSLNVNAAIGRDFNPRSWRITRAQCQVLAGGVIDSPLTRSFLAVGPSHAVTGWALLGPELPDDLAGREVAVLVNVSGLDRVTLGSHLRAHGVRPWILPTPADFEAALAEGVVTVGITESLLAGSIARDHGWMVEMMAGDLPRYPVALGLWKGDLTLKRAVERAYRDLEREGKLDAILARYVAEPEEAVPGT
jgi:polar amino acid transport system substrate-binding protein/cystine transport system substrate-binding protein/membrane-bound lytic murein transglycosylase F